MKDFYTIKDTTGFSRVVVQLQPNKSPIAATDTTDFSRVVIQFWPFGIAGSKLNHHATKVGGI